MMRDPDLVVRAQRAATALERAFDRWRTVHGLGAEPLPPASSYVGYSLEEPWGQPRVVLGIAAEDAEHLAALLERHECAGPVFAAVAGQPGGRYSGEVTPAAGRAAEPGNLGNSLVHVPAQAQPSAGADLPSQAPVAAQTREPGQVAEAAQTGGHGSGAEPIAQAESGEDGARDDGGERGAQDDPGLPAPGLPAPACPRSGR